MASNELASALARRRAKAGQESESPVLREEQSTPAVPTTAPAVAKSSIAERIARLKQQSAAATPAVPTPAASRFNHPVPSTEPLDQLQSSCSSVGSISNASVASAASEPIDTSAVAAAQEAAGIRKASSKIQQLQGSLGIQVNSFARPKGASSGHRTGQRESIMSTGEEQYGNTQHAMGVAMPGLTGTAIPMPGLAKGSFRPPGTAVKSAQNAEASAALDDSHATMNRVAGPKRRGPTRPPPGAFRLPTTAAPNIDNAEPTQSLTSDSTDVTKPLPTKAVELEAPKVPVQLSPPLASETLSARPPLESTHSPASIQQPVATMTSVSTPGPAASLHEIPQPEANVPMKPYQIQDDELKYEKTTSGPSPYAAPGFPSALMANFSVDELQIDDKPISKPVATSTTPPSTLFGTPSPKPEPTPQVLASPAAKVESCHPVPAHAFAPAPTPASEHPPLPSPSVPVVSTPSPSPAPAPVVSTVAPTPAPTPAPVYAPTSTIIADPTPTSSSTLFGGAPDDDDSSESDWSDTENDGGSQSLFGAQDAAPKLAAAAPAPKLAAAPAPVLCTPSQPKAELHQPTSLFSGPSSTPTPDALMAHGSVQVTPQTAIPPAPYSSLFGGAASSSSESDSDFDDGTGLFGT